MKLALLPEFPGWWFTQKRGSRNRVSLTNLGEDAQTLRETRFLSLGDMVSVTGRDRAVPRNRDRRAKSL